MTNFKKQLFSVMTAGALVVNTAGTAFAAEITITGNGAGSDNWATVEQTNTTSVSQSNTANVTNTVNTSANTGENGANFNTGGNTQIGTGDAVVKTNITNDLNRNAATVDCCATGDTDVTISGNGAGTDNGATVKSGSTNAVAQTNVANIGNNVDAYANTGKNGATKNTGGDVTIGTGDAYIETNVSTQANTNVAKVGATLGANNPSASFVISGNGAGSDNYITALLGNTTSVAQTNVANIGNNVDAYANSGKNGANFNTGGDVLVGTGLAAVVAEVDNMVNFNYADVDCGCEYDVLAKIAGNGADYDGWFENLIPGLDDENLIEVKLANTQAVGQGNTANLNNNLYDLDANSGENGADMNTGAVDELSDPAIGTGDSVIESSVSNSGNVNAVGDLPFTMPEMPNVNFSFNMAALMAFFGWSN